MDYLFSRASCVSLVYWCYQAEDGASGVLKNSGNEEHKQQSGFCPPGLHSTGITAGLAAPACGELELGEEDSLQWNSC